MSLAQHFRPASLSAALPAIALAAFAADSVHAGEIVPEFDDADALASFTSPDSDADIDSGTPANGLTLAVRVTPTADDIANSFTGAVNLLEIGGTTNGSSLMIVDGYYWFSTSSGSNTAVPSGVTDVDGTDGAIGVQIAPVVAGQEADVYASLDASGGTFLTSIDGVRTGYTLTGVASGWNWEGNGTLTFAGNNDTTTTPPGSTETVFGWRGGLSDDSAAGVFFTDNAEDFVGTATLGQYFNAVAPIPEPTSAALLGMGGLALLGRRRRA